MTLRDVEATLWFCAGAGLQAVGLVRGHLTRWNRKMLFGIAALSAFFSFSGGLTDVGVLFFVGLFAFFFTIAFRGRILPYFNEQSALFYTLLLFYGLLNSAAEGHPLALFLAKASMLPAAALIVASFLGWEPAKAWRYVFYAWFVFANSALAFISLSYGQGVGWLLDDDLSLGSRAELFLSGMGSIFLGVSAVLFILLIFTEADEKPRLGRRRSTPAEDWKAGVDTMQQHYLGRKLRPMTALGLILAEAALLALNFKQQWLPVPSMISATALFVPASLRLIQHLEEKNG